MTLSSILSSAYSGLKHVLSFLKRHWKWTLAGLLIGLPLLLILMFIFTPTKVSYVTDTAKLEDLVQTVEANGTVTSERDIELKFPALSGLVSEVYVTEGDTVQAGQRLAQLRSSGLGAGVASASASLQAAQAQLDAMEQGNRPEDIAVSQADLESKRASLLVAQQSLQTAISNAANSQQKLDALRRELDVSTAGDIAQVPSTIGKNLASVQGALQSISSIFGRNDVQNAISHSSNSNGYSVVLNLQTNAMTAIGAALQAPTPTTNEAAVASLQNAKAAAQQASTALQQAYMMISTLSESSDYPHAAIETDKATLSTNQTTVQTGVSGLDTAISNLRGAAAGNDSRIIAEQSNLDAANNAKAKAQADILTYQAAVNISQAQLDLKRAGSRPQDIEAQRARVRQASAELARAASSYNDTVLVAPMDGTVTQVNIKPGEFTPSGPAMTMLGFSPYRIEMFVSEIDIPKVQLTQSGSIELDAFRGTNFKLHVSDIDPAATNKDGVSKYRVKLDFNYPHDDLKIGMTGDAQIITGIRPQVVTVPLRAVLEDATGKKVVRILNGTKVEERTVTTGMDGSNGEVEVTGVKEGETVIVLQK